MCNKVILENGRMLIFVPDCCKNRKICDNVDNYAHALGAVPHCYKIQKLCNKVVCTYPFTIQS